PRVLPRPARWRRPRRLPRPHHRRPGRPAQRRHAALRQPAAVASGRGRRPPRARDLRRRREVRARRHRRPARRGQSVLPARARPRRAPCPPAADLRLRRRGARPHRPRAIACPRPQRPARAPAGRRTAGGARMNARTDARQLALAGDFPILARPIHGRRLAYLDNGATTQKPDAVIEAERRFYRESNANIHRGVHRLSQEATELDDVARETVRRLPNARAAEELVFTRGTTEAINLVAASWGRANLKAGDEILLTALEHHSNIVPWQLLCEQTGATIRVVPVSDAGELELAAFEQLLGERTR